MSPRTARSGYAELLGIRGALLCTTSAMPNRDGMARHSETASELSGCNRRAIGYAGRFGIGRHAESSRAPGVPMPPPPLSKERHSGKARALDLLRTPQRKGFRDRWSGRFVPDSRVSTVKRTTRMPHARIATIAEPRGLDHGALAVEGNQITDQGGEVL